MDLDQAVVSLRKLTNDARKFDRIIIESPPPVDLTDADQRDQWQAFVVALSAFRAWERDARQVLDHVTRNREEWVPMPPLLRWFPSSDGQRLEPAPERAVVPPALAVMMATLSSILLFGPLSEEWFTLGVLRGERWAMDCVLIDLLDGE